MLAFRPTKEWIEGLQVGDLAQDVFGNVSKIVNIYARGRNIHGKVYICLYIQHGSPGSSISQSYTEGEVEPTIGLTNKYHQTRLYPEEVITSDFKKIKEEYFKHNEKLAKAAGLL